MTIAPDSHDLVEVAMAARESEADIVVALLAANGIDAFASTRLPSSVYPNVANAVRVLVHADDAEDARNLIAGSPGDDEPSQEEE